MIGNATITVTDQYGNTLVVNEATGNYVDTIVQPYDKNGNLINDVFNFQFTDLNGNTASANLTFIESNSSQSLGPIVLDLTGAGINLISAQNSPVSIDVGNNQLDQIGWIASNEGILMYDPSGSGKLTSTSQISFVSDVPGAQTDLQGLLAFDTNHNGVLDAGDTNFSKFGVLLSNGQFESLTALGITSISLTSNNQVEIMNGNVINGLTTYQTVNGQSHVAADVNLAIKSNNGPVLNLNDILPAPIHFDFSSLDANTSFHSINSSESVVRESHHPETYINVYHRDLEHISCQLDHITAHHLHG